MSMSQMMMSLECIVRKVSPGSRTGRGGWLAARKAPLLTKACEQYYFLILPQRSFSFEGVHRNMSLNTWIVFCIISAMWGIRLWLRSSWPAGCVVIRPWFLSKCFQCMPMKKYTTSRQPCSKSLQFLFACEPGNLKALYSPCFNIKLEFGDCGPVCPGGAAAQALKKTVRPHVRALSHFETRN